MMFWAIQNQSINMAEVMIERMEFASAQVWDKKCKLNVSLPYAHLLTKVFQHSGINLSGAVSEQAIRSRNLKKSGFSLVAGVWTKTSAAEGEAIIGKALETQEGEDQEIQEQAAQEEPQVAAVIPVVQEEPTVIAAPTVQAVATDIRECVSDIQEEQAAGIIQEIVKDISSSERRLEDIPSEHLKPVEQLQVIVPPTIVGSVLIRVLDSIPSTQSVQEVAIVEDAVASGHIANVVMEEAPIQGEQEIATEDGKQQRERSNFWDSSLDQESSSKAEKEEIEAKEMGMVRNAMRWVRNPVRSAGPSGPVSEDPAGPSGPVSEEPAGPSGPQVVEKVAIEMDVHVEVVKAGPLGPSKDVVRPTGPVISKGEIPRVEEPAVAPEAPDPSSLVTPDSSSPPSSSIAPPAPIPFKQPMPRSISSPTPFLSESSSSPAISTSIPPPPPEFEDPPTSSSSGPSSARPSIIPPPTHQSFFILLLLPPLLPLYLKTYFEEQEYKALRIIQRHASLLSPAFYLHDNTRNLSKSYLAMLGALPMGCSHDYIVWAQSTHWFTSCERDRDRRHVLNATVLGVTFWLPPLEGLHLHVRRVSRAGRPTDVGHEKATTSYVTFRSRWEGMSRSQLRSVFNLGRPNRAQQALFGQGEEIFVGSWGIRGFGVVFGVVSPRGRGTERGKRRGIAVLRILHEVSHFRELGPESLEMPGMDLRQCGLQEWCLLVFTVSWLVLVEQQLDLSSVAARLRCSHVLFVRVRESRRLLALLLVQSRTVAKLGVVLVGLHYSLACACGTAVGPFVRDCETERVCPGVGAVVVGERRLTGCGLTYVVCPVVGTVVSRFCPWWRAL
ncbi:hypothetical protein Taro_010182 [Colocasia esculenta]|uniref:Uncharacterized protein n=1 Tax=Colocasia esculenta TaxID=4460 RepID=A0A843U2X8_COLES|nr:hypothetical protein [Colocasia esculenta]